MAAGPDRIPAPDRLSLRLVAGRLATAPSIARVLTAHCRDVEGQLCLFQGGSEFNAVGTQFEARGKNVPTPVWAPMNRRSTRRAHAATLQAVLTATFRMIMVRSS